MGKCWENDGGSWILDDFRVFPTTLATQIKHDSSMRRICERLVVKKIRRNGKTVCDLRLPVCSICSIFQTQNSLKYLKIAFDLYVNVTCWSSAGCSSIITEIRRPEWSTYPEAVALPRCPDDARYVQSLLAKLQT